jgi:uncharacterized protein YcgL (UPF0745 family)
MFLYIYIFLYFKKINKLKHSIKDMAVTDKPWLRRAPGQRVRQVVTRTTGLTQEQIQKVETLSQELEGLTIEQYEERYQDIPQELQQYFQKPAEVRTVLDAQRSEYVSANIQKVNSFIEQEKRILAEIQDNYNDYRKWWKELSSEDKKMYGSEYYGRSLKDYSIQMNEVKDIIRYLERGLNEVGKGYQPEPFINYAYQKASQDRDRRYDDLREQYKPKEMKVTITDIPAQRLTFKPGELNKQKQVVPTPTPSKISAPQSYVTTPVDQSFYDKAKLKVQELGGGTRGPEMSKDIKKGVLRMTDPLFDFSNLLVGARIGAETQIPEEYVPQTITAYTPGADPGKLFAVSDLRTPGELVAEEIQREGIRDTFRVQNRIRDEVEDKLTNEANIISRELQVRIDAGEDYDKVMADATRADKRLMLQAEQDVERILKQETELSQSKVDKIVKDYTKSVAPTFIQKVGVGAILSGISLIPGVGGVVKTGLAARFAVSAPEIIKATREDPFGTFKEIVPYAIGGLIVGAVQKGIQTVKTSQGKYQLQSVDFSFNNAVKVGKNLWDVNGMVKTAIKNTKTGKVETIYTKTYSNVRVMATTKSGALKSAVSTTSLTFRNELLRLGIKPNVVTRFELGRATGRVTLNPTQQNAFWDYYGTGTFDIFKSQPLTLKQGFGEGIIKGKTYYVAQPKYQALQNILVKEFGKSRTTEIIRGKAKLTLKEQQFLAAVKTDVYLGSSAEAILKGFGISITKTLEPSFSFTSEPIGFSPTPSTLVTDYGSQSALAVASAKSSAEAIATKIGGTMIQRARVTDVTRAVTTPDVSSLLIGTGAGARQVVKTKVKDVQFTYPVIRPIKSVKDNVGAKVSSILFPIVTTKEKGEFRTIGDLIGVVSPTTGRQKPLTGQPQMGRQPQAQQLRQPSALRLASLQSYGYGLSYPGFAMPPIIPKPRIRIPPFQFGRESKADKMLRLRREKEMREAQKRYQASVGAVSLGIGIDEKYYKRMRKQFTGFELRPMITSKKKRLKRYNYNPYKINKILGGF